MPLLVPLLLAVWLSGCSSVGYYTQLARGQWALLHARQPVEQVIADAHQDPALRQRLALSQQARDFASRELHLPDNRSYRLYAALDRPYVVWNLFATEEFSLAPRNHCFPIAGCVAYRGYYDQNRARGAAAVLRQQGLDTYVAGVDAYSTLGWFDDPLLSTMLRWDDERLAATIFHELAHQQYYLPGDTAFNESFASFVEREGSRQWRAHRGMAAPAFDRSRQRDEFTALVLDTRARLEHLYARPLSAEQLRQRKAWEFERLRRQYRHARDSRWQGDRRYDAWVEAPLNNAKLLPFGLYDRWVPAFARLFAQQHEDWPAFYRQVKALGEQEEAARHRQLERLMDGAVE